MIHITYTPLSRLSSPLPLEPSCQPSPCLGSPSPIRSPRYTALACLACPVLRFRVCYLLSCPVPSLRRETAPAPGRGTQGHVCARLQVYTHACVAASAHPPACCATPPAINASTHCQLRPLHAPAERREAFCLSCLFCFFFCRCRCCCCASAATCLVISAWLQQSLRGREGTTSMGMGMTGESLALVLSSADRRRGPGGYPGTQQQQARDPTKSPQVAHKKRTHRKTRPELL